MQYLHSISFTWPSITHHPLHSQILSNPTYICHTLYLTIQPVIFNHNLPLGQTFFLVLWFSYLMHGFVRSSIVKTLRTWFPILHIISLLFRNSLISTYVSKNFGPDFCPNANWVLCVAHKTSNLYGLCFSPLYFKFSYFIRISLELFPPQVFAVHHDFLDIFYLNLLQSDLVTMYLTSNIFRIAWLLVYLLGVKLNLCAKLRYLYHCSGLLM